MTSMQMHSGLALPPSLGVSYGTVHSTNLAAPVTSHFGMGPLSPLSWGGGGGQGRPLSQVEQCIASAPMSWRALMELVHHPFFFFFEVQIVAHADLISTNSLPDVHFKRWLK